MHDSTLNMMGSTIVALVVFMVIFALISPQQEQVSVKNIVTNKYTDIEAVFLSGSHTAYYLEINNSDIIQVGIEEYNRYAVNDSIMQYETLNHDSHLIRFLKWLGIMKGE